MAKRKHLASEAEFSIGKGKSLVISLSSSVGLDRIIVKNENGSLSVRARGHSSFEFSDKKQEPGGCDFWLANPSTTPALKEYLEGRFWGQLTWGELFRRQNNTELKRALKAEIQKLVDDFADEAAQRLNSILKKQKNKKK